MCADFKQDDKASPTRFSVKYNIKLLFIYWKDDLQCISGEYTASCLFIGDIWDWRLSIGN